MYNQGYSNRPPPQHRTPNYNGRVSSPPFPNRPASASPPPLQHPIPTHPFHVRDTGTPTPPPSSSQHYGGHGRGMYGHNNTGYSSTSSASMQGRGQQGGQGVGDFNQMLGIDDATARLGMQFGKSAVLAGHDYVEKNFNRYVNLPALKNYFNVTNTYVLNKIQLLLFPWRHKPWSRSVKRSEQTGQMEGYLPPREDINSPDLYIPTMAFVTYVLLVGLIQGRARAFHPEQLGITASSALATIGFEIFLMKLGCYLLNITSDSQVLDLLAYSGYKFVGVILTLLAKLLLPNWAVISWVVFFYTAFSVGFFLLRSLRYMVLPDSSTTTATASPQRKRRVYFLFVLAALQLVFMFVLL
ncbi:uncharacterized protein VTP21DRAFT_667 [Calcarisporiella thermophila]|uniref:uncharacterized protein n=1 Tax=Calcarisporiella thermophila TaxID=911321 RepID=UPI00374319BD